MYLLLSSLTVLRSCFPSLQVIGELIIWSHVQPGLSVIFFWQIRTIFISLFAGLAVLFFARPRRTLSLFDSFSAKLPWLHFYSTSQRLLVVVSSNTRFNLWKIHFTFSPKWISSGSACKQWHIPRSSRWLLAICSENQSNINRTIAEAEVWRTRRSGQRQMYIRIS